MTSHAAICLVDEVRRARAVRRHRPGAPDARRRARPCRPRSPRSMGPCRRRRTPAGGIRTSEWMSGFRPPARRAAGLLESRPPQRGAPRRTRCTQRTGADDPLRAHLQRVAASGGHRAGRTRDDPVPSGLRQPRGDPTVDRARPRHPVRSAPRVPRRGLVPGVRVDPALSAGATWRRTSACWAPSSPSTSPTQD